MVLGRRRLGKMQDGAEEVDLPLTLCLAINSLAPRSLRECEGLFPLGIVNRVRQCTWTRRWLDVKVDQRIWGTLVWRVSKQPCQRSYCIPI